MEILIAIISIIAGLFLMMYAGDKLVDGSVAIAKRYGISEAIIGLTIVAIGTSMPELVVSILASLQGSTDLAVGNVLGSNIANIYLALGIAAFLVPISLSKTTRFFDLPVVMFSTLMLFLMVGDRALDGAGVNLISRSDGIVFLIFAAMYMGYSVKHNNFSPDEFDHVPQKESPLKSYLLVVASIIGLVIGGRFLVDGAVAIASGFGISESIVGLTVVAIGTSAPEIITSVIASKKWNPEIALWNLVGSSMMNIFVILGVTSIIHPLPFSSNLYFDLSIALLAPMLVIVLAMSRTTRIRHQLGRWDGLILVGVYILYIAYLIFQEIS